MTSEEHIRSIGAASNAALEVGDVPAFLAAIDGDYLGTAGNGVTSGAGMRWRS